MRVVAKYFIEDVEIDGQLVDSMELTSDTDVDRDRVLHCLQHSTGLDIQDGVARLMNSNGEVLATRKLGKVFKSFAKLQEIQLSLCEELIMQ